MRRSSARSERGFTLIELLVVIAIIGILSSVILASLNTARARARDTQRIQSLTQIRNAISLYMLDNNGTYPPTGNTSTGDWPAGFKSALAPYMPNLPLDPVSNQAGPSVWRYFQFSNCGATGSSCAWLNSPQTGTACAGKMVLISYNTDAQVQHQDCPTTFPGVMTVIVGDIP